LDATFGGDGIVITTVGARSTVNATAIQDDGKIVAAGFGTGTAAAVVAVARYLPGPRCAQRAEPSNCRTAERSLLMADRVGDARRQRLVWKWWRGQTTSPAEFGDPTTTTDYALCFYGGSDGTLIGEAAIYVPANGTRWRRVRTGYRYHDQAGNADGVRRAWLRSSGRARTRLYFRARGAGLPELAAALAPESLPLIVRWTGNDACWESRFTAADVTVANGGSFEARSR
jgi:hypothetical protein